MKLNLKHYNNLWLLQVYVMLNIVFRNISQRSLQDQQCGHPVSVVELMKCVIVQLMLFKKPAPVKVLCTDANKDILVKPNNVFLKTHSNVPVCHKTF